MVHVPTRTALAVDSRVAALRQHRRCRSASGARRLLALLAALALTTAAGSGCGGDEGEGSTAPGPSSERSGASSTLATTPGTGPSSEVPVTGPSSTGPSSEVPVTGPSSTVVAVTLPRLRG
ncbi:MAG: hypothetical protein EA398_15700 [Deltaproteobacteria bacterium]|nr:MAG: hypothetical protein EA398_15700 [Deltaproteobacteria bacterium]